MSPFPLPHYNTALSDLSGAPRSWLSPRPSSGKRLVVPPDGGCSNGRALRRLREGPPQDSSFRMAFSLFSWRPLVLRSGLRPALGYRCGSLGSFGEPDDERTAVLMTIIKPV